MEQTTLYRKYRPITFSQVIGQSFVVNTLKNQLTSGNISHAYLFCGTRGTGKTTVAKIFSRSVNCLDLQPNGDPCNKCEACTGLLNGTILDVSEIDAASNRRVDDIRLIRNEVQYAPTALKYRVYIIDEVHMLTGEAFNALLKTLEEPPKNTIFILATTEAHKVPLTIQSRCQRFDFRRISNKDITSHLLQTAKDDNFELAPDAASVIATLADGAMRDALSILDQCKGVSGGKVTLDVVQNTLGVVGRNMYFNLADAIADKSMGDALSIANKILTGGSDASVLANTLLAHYRDLAVCKNVDSPEEILDEPSETIEKLKEQCKKYSTDKIIACMQGLSEIIANLKFASSPRVLVESTILQLSA
ncbi:MAG: DNA polymerase III subunit gamma/tau [Clostridiales bacterium]|jgi:DNA polymerase-3 subunit gamma/tau|nr:DNA polymerase III subunit gamma/tau [Clostridiales bacterium]